MKSLPYWIQRADFCTTEHEPIDCQEAIRLLARYDWAEELAFQEALASKGIETCDPGIGFVAKEGNILHICPVSSNHAYFHYHFIAQRKLLKIFSTHRFVVRVSREIPWTDIPEVIARYFADDHAWLLLNTTEE